MQSLEVDSPFPYIALGIPKDQKTEVEEDSSNKSKYSRLKVCLVLMELGVTIFAFGVFMRIVSWPAPVSKYEVNVTHTYIRPDCTYYETDYYDENDDWDEDWSDPILEQFLKPNIKDTGESPFAGTYNIEDAPGRETLSDTLYRMCSNVVPLEWPRDWKDDPQILSREMKEDLEFCSMVFHELADDH